MAELLLLNPKSRKAKPKRKKARSAAQKAAIKKLVVFNKRRRNPTKTTVRKTPVKKRRTAAQKSATRKLVAFNRARKGGSTPTVKRRRRNPVAKYVQNPVRRRRAKTKPMVAIRRRRRNPVKRMNIQKQAMSAFQSSLGALGLDLLWGYAPVPIDMKTGQFRHLIKGAGAIVMGMLAEMVVSKPQAAKLVEGALVVTFHDAMKEFIAVNVPAVQLGYYSPGMPAGQMDAYIGSEGTSPYLSPSNLSTPFEGPSAAAIARGACPSVENEGNMGHYY